MRLLYCFLLIAFTAVVGCNSSKTLPDNFLGKFKLEKDENFDEYLVARGFGWFMRQLIKLASVTKVIRRAASGAPNHYDFENLTTKKDTHHTNFELGKEFQDEALDSTQHKITFDLKNGDTLTEKHIKVDDPNDVETYEYTIQGDYLVMKMTWNGVSTLRYYKRQ